MGTRVLGRAIVLGAAVGLLAAGVVLADVVRADGDILDTDIDSFVELGVVAPGTVIELEVGFELQCSSFNHVNPDQRVVITAGARSIPPGAAADYTGAVIDPPGARWPLDGDLCPSPSPDPVRSAVPAEVTLTAPMTPGEGYLYTLSWTRAVSPPIVGESNPFVGTTAVSFTLDVVANTPPTLVLPAGVELEGNTIGGAIAAYDVAAADAEDDADPSPVCSPAVGELLPLGATTVSCTATDQGGLTATGSFVVTVADTGAPGLHGLPSGLSLATADPAGATIAYTLPTATDIVDPSPVVTCVPGPGAGAPVGDSTVTCTARDGSGNTTSAAFPVRVTLWTAAWDSPIGGGASMTANGGRTLPVKVRLFADGAEVRTGTPLLRAVRCDGTGPAVDSPLVWGGGNGRWNGHLDTGMLQGTGCYRVTAVVDGLTVATFDLEVTGSLNPVKAKAPSGRGQSTAGERRLP